MIGSLTPVNLTPLMDPSLAHYIYSNASGVQLYEDNTGAIVDANGNDQDPNTGDMYQDEISGPYTTPPLIPFPSSPGSGTTPAPPSSKNWAACESVGNPGILQSIENFLVNTTGNLSQAQIAALIAQEQACLINAGMDSTSALAVATADINNALNAAKAASSPWYKNPWLWAIAGGGLLLLAAARR